jgi:hypothetical protein
MAGRGMNGWLDGTRSSEMAIAGLAGCSKEIRDGLVGGRFKNIHFNAKIFIIKRKFA